MRQDELKTNAYTTYRAKEHVSNSFFRWVANLRDRTVSYSGDTVHVCSTLACLGVALAVAQLPGPFSWRILHRA